MKNLRPLLALSAVLLLLTLVGCATTGPALPKLEEMSGLKGQTFEEITQRFGPPDRRYTDSNNNLVCEYKRSAASRGFENGYMAFTSVGILSGNNSAYVDVMRLTFYRGVVANYAFEENLPNMGMPGMINTQTPPAMPVAEPTPAPQKAPEPTLIKKKVIKK